MYGSGALRGSLGREWYRSVKNKTDGDGALRGGGFSPSAGVHPKGTVTQACRASFAQTPTDAGAWSIRAL